jgi:hypothetical protein
MYPLAENASFAEQFIRTCSDWKTPWINDRIYPWRPFIYVPRASQIDALLRKELGMSYSTGLVCHEDGASEGSCLRGTL